ncbi:phosphoglycerate kinase [Bdellovibrio bacteriovorus]|uniref:Phosphoglycerate kinase n=1 Tax=Bdellovibrio bacteriovorus TaxID=959 RepID=A0A161QEJ4_BDEBC|nr:phosphoglycerate kinase [Bdellovibrio bacteriovorus]KYG62647.1 phosphoglycerate kinase [Bdellovibrio bacteriovorus]
MANGLKGIKTVRDFELEGKVVFLRLDLNVPMENGKITDENRITASLPTIQYCMEKGAKLVMASHLGRPKTKDDKEFSLEPVAKRLQELLSAEVILVEDPDSDAPKHLLQSLKKNQLILLENVRFEEGETKDSVEFAQKIANYSDIYINDAFGASHRAHATIHALPSVMKDKGIGFLIEKEITMLDSLLQNPKRPYLALMGGSKVSDKIAVIERLMDVVDGFIIGGAMAYTFLKAQGISVGKSLVENDKLKYAKEMIERIEARNKTILLPVDHVTTKSFGDTASARTTKDVVIADDELAVDIGPKTIQNYSTALREAGTIFWNGPMGVFETPAFAKGTFGVAQAIAESNAIKIVGGGDSAAAAEASGFADKMTHISTGGGASLEYLQGDKLPGLEILRAKR